MKYTPPSKELFIRNRSNFADKMKPNYAAIFFSNTLVPSNADAYYPFEQNRDMYFMSGLDQEECVLLIWPDAPKEEWKEIMFIRRTSEEIQIWEGWKYSQEEATEASGVEKVMFFDGFQKFFRQMIPHVTGFYLDFNEHERSHPGLQTASHDLAKMLQDEFPGHKIKRCFPIVEKLRESKGPEEVDQIKIACGITEKAFRRVMKFIKPGVWEHEIEAEMMHEFLRNRATRPAYHPIIATGNNANVLHYVLNNAECKDGELILMDFGAEYGNYASDLTRTIPVNGKFTDRQKEVYNACLNVFKGARDLFVPGTTLDEINKKAGEMMEDELLRIGLITQKEIDEQDEDKPAFKKYFMHGTSHFIGLDTHDVGNRYAKLRPGMVLTCEPGIYIPEEGFGIRIENDILVTTGKPVDLMASIPIEVEEIEAAMAK